MQNSISLRTLEPPKPKVQTFDFGRRPMEELGDIERLRIQRMLEHDHYRILFEQLQKFQAQGIDGKNNYYKHGVMKEIIHLLETAKILTPVVRSEFLKKSYNWYMMAITGNKNVSTPNAHQPSLNQQQRLQQNNAEQSNSIIPLENFTQKSSLMRPQSSMNRPSKTASTASRPFTAAARRLVRPDSCKMTLASTKITTDPRNDCQLEEKYTDLFGNSKHVDICEELSDYSNCHRTIYPDMDAPCDILKRRANLTNNLSLGILVRKKMLQKDIFAKRSASKVSNPNQKQSSHKKFEDQPNLIVDVVDDENDMSAEESQAHQNQEPQQATQEAFQIQPSYKRFQRIIPDLDSKKEPLGQAKVPQPKQNRILIDERETEQLTQMISEWRRSKSRQRKQTNRKTESAKYPRPQSAKAPMPCVPQKSDVSEINLQRREFSAQVNAKPPIRRPITKMKTLNRYKSAGTIDINLTSIVGGSQQKMRKPMINPLDPAFIEKENQQNLDQIDQIKRLLRKNTNIPIRSLTNALIYNKDVYQQCVKYPHEYMMIRNPFLKKKKKKTRKLRKASAKK